MENTFPAPTPESGSTPPGACVVLSPESGTGSGADGHAPDPDSTAAGRLAIRLGLPLRERAQPADVLALEITGLGLQLRDLRPGAPGAVRVELLGGPGGHGGRDRLLRAGGNSELLGRAVGARRGRRPWVVDATAGLGGDAAILAAMGCRVTMLERSAVVAALLRDGLTRALAMAGTGPDLAMLQRLTLVHADASAWLAGLPIAGQPDVVYLDPMYPDTGRSALARKEMQLLQLLLGHGDEAPGLLAAALAAARQRVVVKRPRKAPVLQGPQSPPQPSHCIGGKSTRFDVYMTGHERPSTDPGE